MKPILIVCLCLVPLGISAEEVLAFLQVQTNSSSLQLTLTVLGETDSDTQRLDGTISLAVDCFAPLAAASLRDFQVRAVTNFDLQLSFGFLGALSGSLNGLAIRHGDPGPHQPYVPVIGGQITFLAISNVLDGSATYQATGAACAILQNDSLPCSDTILLANQPTSPIDELSGSLTLTNGVLRFVGGFVFGPLTLVAGGTLSGVANITASGPLQPCLQIERTLNEHRVRYSSAFHEFRLERTGSLSAPVVWEPAVAKAVVDDGTTVTATFQTLTDNMAFYRLALSP